MPNFPDSSTIKPTLFTPSRTRVTLSAARYLLRKALSIAATIFVGIFITMVIVNYPVRVRNQPPSSQFQLRLEAQIKTVIQIAALEGIIPRETDGSLDTEAMDILRQKLEEEAGLNLPFLPKYLYWTLKVLSFDWGGLNSAYFPQLGISQGLRNRPTSNAVLQYLPNTLLLVGTAYLLVFLIGMPFSLYLARHYGGWLDRIMLVLSPISSVPSWVFAMLLVMIFAVQLRWLPVAGMFDFHKPEHPLPYVMALLRHMVLPVTALVLSLLFQLIYTWRTFFIIYSEEDYVDLARAKGLDTRLLEKRYILRPALPYIITSFAASLIGFWQLTVALEKIFQWPGIGLLYIEVLPNFWHESMEIGDLIIVIQIVVTFSYLLGILVFVLDLTYVIVDPRIHLIPASYQAQVKRKRRAVRSLFRRMRPGFARPAIGRMKEEKFSLQRTINSLKQKLGESGGQIRLFAEQLRLYPSANFGLTVIILLLAGSIYALVALPYAEIGMDYSQGRVRGRNLRPSAAAPAWLNLFSKTPHLSALVLDEKSSGVSVEIQTLENGWQQKTTTFTFDYHYKEIPSDVFLYLDSVYVAKIPFISLTWTTPDGRAIDLKSKAMGGEDSYDLENGTFIRRLLAEHPEWNNWFVEEGKYPTPAYKLLFAKPGVKESLPQQGLYQLKITSLLFEEDSDVQAQLAVLGHVYGLAGTDYWRRDLIVPLFWGMPFSLMVGFLGTLITALIALLLPAIGIWFGGGLDTLIQRMSEVNMVLPGLAIAALAYALFNVPIWTILGVVVVLNAFGAPIKIFRSALLQAREASYIEMARSYGAGNFRIITRYLVPRILPVLIPYLVMQLPTFVFLEATLGFFNIRSIYPSWGRIIYDGLTRGALYGSPFWVLEPIFLLLLTGLAFAMLGLALERILNPRVISDVPTEASQPRTRAIEPDNAQRKNARSRFKRRLVASMVVMILAVAIFVPTVQGKPLASIFIRYLDPSQKVDTRIKNAEPVSMSAPTSTSPVPAPVTSTPVSLTPSISTPTLLLAAPGAGLSCIPANSAAPARVMDIIDGNTVRVLMNDLVYVVRYLGVETPRDTQNSREAYLKNSALVFQKNVTLIADEVDKDPDGRLLRYVLVGDMSVNLQLLQEGLARVADSPSGIACMEEFRTAQQMATQSARGLWAAPTPVP